MKPFPTNPFLILPSHFLLLGIFAYIGLELVASLILENYPQYHAYEQMITLWVRLLELLAIGYLIRHFRVGESLGLKLPGGDEAKIFALISVCCVLMVGILLLVDRSWLAYISLPQWLDGMTGLFLMVLLAPIVEELVFRGLLYRMLREQWGVVVSITVSSVFFSLMHHGMLVSPQLAGGIIFAFAYEWSRSLWVSIALHMGANGAVYTLSVLF